MECPTLSASRLPKKKTPGSLSLAGRLNHRVWIHAMEEDLSLKSIALGSIKGLTAP